MIDASRLSRYVFAMVTAHTLLVTLALAAPPSDLVFEQTTVVYDRGRPVGPGVRSRVFFAGRCVRLEAGDASGGPALLLRLDLGRAWRLDPEQRLAVELNADRLRARSHTDASVASGLLGGGEDAGLRTTVLPGSRTIAGHACRGFRLSGPSTSIEVWVASDLGVGVEVFAEFLEWSGAAQSLGGLLGEIRRLPGFPLETRSRVSVLGEERETVSTVVTIRVGPQPRERFEVPPGWKVVSEDHPESGGPQ